MIRINKSVVLTVLTVLVLGATCVGFVSIMPGMKQFESVDRKVFEAVVVGRPRERSRGDHFDLRVEYVVEGEVRHMWLYLPKRYVNPKGCLFQSRQAGAGEERHCGGLVSGKKVALVGAYVGKTLEPVGVYDRITGEAVIGEHVFYDSLMGDRIKAYMALILFGMTAIGISAHAVWRAWHE